MTVAACYVPERLRQGARSWLDDLGAKVARESAQWVAAQVAPLPPTFAALVLKGRQRRINALSGSDGLRAGNRWMVEQVGRLDRFAVDLSASDDDIRAFAVECVDDVRSFLAALVVSDRDAVRRHLAAYAKRRAGHEWPEKTELAGIVGRMTDAAWWRRVLRRFVGRGVDQSARELGLVHRRAGLYCADETARWHTQQQQRNRKILEGQEAVNQHGQAFGLDELADKGLAKPANRRADLMVRIRGFEEYAKAKGHAGVFVTWTAPSAFHPRHRHGSRNDRYEDGRTPRDAQALIGGQWAKARAKLQRLGVRPYGFRVVEPHHDGTPHWHMLLFVDPVELDSMVAELARYAREPWPHEMTTEAARRARFDFKMMTDGGGKGWSAAGYVAKYIAKNLDGEKEGGGDIGADFEATGEQSAADTSARVRAWASRWGIRQFQQIGGPAVTGYRELRRLRDLRGPVVQGDFFDVWKAADAGLWGEFVERCGGIDIKRAERPLQLSRQESGRLNRYGEEAAPDLIGVEWRGVFIDTRPFVWVVRPKRGGVGKGEASAAWTRVNNCTGEGRNAAEKRSARAPGACAGRMDGGACARPGNGGPVRRPDSGGAGRPGGRGRAVAGGG